MATASDPVGGDDLSALEARVEAGDPQAARTYTQDAMKHHAGNRDESHRRRMLLGRVNAEVVTQTECFGLLSALMADRKGWDMAIRRIGESLDPGFGFLAWRLILFHTEDEGQAEDWFFAVEDAAMRGHFPAREAVLQAKLKSAGVLSSLSVRWDLAKLELERQALEEQAPEDRRLARYE